MLDILTGILVVILGGAGTTIVIVIIKRPIKYFNEKVVEPLNLLTFQVDTLIEYNVQHSGNGFSTFYKQRQEERINEKKIMKEECAI
jgi:hypothetical protein